jgi:hypothetical protein
MYDVGSVPVTSSMVVPLHLPVKLVEVEVEVEVSIEGLATPEDAKATKPNNPLEEPLDDFEQLKTNSKIKRFVTKSFESMSPMTNLGLDFHSGKVFFYSWFSYSIF